MHPIRKKILTDESQQPVAVQIEYADWLLLEKWLESQPLNGVPPPATDLNLFAGTLPLREDPLLQQQRLRDEWQ